MSKAFDLERFVEAQAPIYRQALAELEAGEKRSHWMWFVFPQLLGLGQSDMARRYGISGLAEAVAYLRHPLLGERIETCSRALLAHSGKTARQIMGSPDDLKLRSSMTLFHVASGGAPLFRLVLVTFFDGRQDPATLERLLDAD